MRKIIVAVAPVSLDHYVNENSHLSPRLLADDIIECYKRGATVVHLHVRDEKGKPSNDLGYFSETLDYVKDACDIIVNGSTGGVSDLTLEERCVSLNEDRVEMGSLNMGSINLMESGYINTFSDIRYWAGRMHKQNVMPELEIFEAGMINNVDILLKEGVLREPLIFGLAAGFKGSIPATTKHLQHLVDLLPVNSSWGFSHHGMKDLSVCAAALAMGASVLRVGFEDSMNYAPGKEAKTNAELVEKLVDVIRAVGFDVANAGEARKMLGLCLK